jgi:undecaprenyl-diphosphatase
MGRADIVAFSFLLAIPTMLAATSYDLLKNGASFVQADWKMLAIGFAVSFIAAYASVRWLIRYVQTHTFTAFGWYRIVLGVVILGTLSFV